MVMVSHPQRLQAHRLHAAQLLPSALGPGRASVAQPAALASAAIRLAAAVFPAMCREGAPRRARTRR